MQTKTTNLTITVFSPQGVPHYEIIKRGITMKEVDGYIALLRFLRYKHKIDDGVTSFLITLKEPDLMAAEIIIYNNCFLRAFGISEIDVVIPALQLGDSMFWDLFEVIEYPFVNKLFSNATNKELEKYYKCSDSTLTRRTKNVFERVRFKYPQEKFKNRKQFILFGLKFGVCVEVRCKTCRQII